jgi:peptidoglycan/xylan/chitin deacetylase (PgdA/CDA1 family)
MLALCYHAVSSAWPAPLSVTPDSLERQLVHLLEQGYRGVTFSEASLADVEDKVLAVTFDDGYASVAALAAPILSRVGVPGTVFVPTDYIGENEPMQWRGIDRWADSEYAQELLPMRWDEARALADDGWEIGSHSCSHRDMTLIDDDGLDLEMTRSRERVESELSRPCTSFAFPFGQHTPQVVEAALRAGYQTTAGLPRGRWARAKFIVPRVGVYHRDGDLSFRLKVSRMHRWLRASKVWSPFSLALRGVRSEPSS